MRLTPIRKLTLAVENLNVCGLLGANVLNKDKHPELRMFDIDTGDAVLVQRPGHANEVLYPAAILRAVLETDFSDMNEVAPAKAAPVKKAPVEDVAPVEHTFGPTPLPPPPPADAPLSAPPLAPLPPKQPEPPPSPALAAAEKKLKAKKSLLGKK